MEKRRPFRLYIQILLFSTLIGLGALILLSLQRVVQKGITGVRDGLITRLEQRIDRKIRYSSISPSFFGSFDVRNVQIMGEDGRPVLSVSRFRVAYSLLDLLRGKAQAIHSVRLDTPYFDLDVTRDHDLINLFESVRSGEDGSLQDFSAIFPEKLLVRIRNGKCLVSSGREQYHFDVLNLSAEFAGDRIILDSRWNIGLLVNQMSDDPVKLQMALRVNGSCQSNMEEGEAVFNVISIAGDAQSDIPVSFSMTLRDGVIGLQKMENQLPFDFSVRYGIDSGAIDARLDCVDIQLRQYLSVSGMLENFQQLLDITSSGTAYFVRNRDGSLAYSVDMAGAVPVGGAAFEIKAAGDENRVHVDSMRFSLSETDSAQALFFGDVNFSGDVRLSPFAPEGVLSLINFSLSGQESVNAAITVNSKNNAQGTEINAFCESFTLGGLELSSLNALLQPAGNDIGFTVSVEKKQAGAIALEGSMNSETRRIEANLFLDSFPAGDLNDIASPFMRETLLPPPLKSFLGGTTISTEIFLTTDFTHLIYNAPHLAISGGIGKRFSGFASVSGTDLHFALNEGRLVWGDETLLLSGQADFADQKNISFSIDANYRELGYFIEGVINEKTVHIQGPYGLNISLDASAGAGYSGTMFTDKFPVPFLGQPALVSAVAQMRYETAESWSMNLEHFEIVDITSPAGPARMRVSGAANQDGAVIPLLYFSDKLGPISGRADITWTHDFSSFAGTAGLKGGMENYQVTGSLMDRHLNLSLSGMAMRLERVLGNRSNAQADGSMALSWDSIESFRAEFRLSSVRGRLLEKEFTAEAAAVLNHEALTVSSLRVNYAGLEGVLSPFTIDAARGSAGARAELTGVAGKKPITGHISLTAAFNPIQSWQDIDKVFSSFDGKVRVEGFAYGEEEPPQNFEFVFSRAEGALALSGGPRNMLRFTMDPEGSFYAGLSSPFPVRGTVIGSIKQRIINARCNDLYMDMGELFNLLPETDSIYLTGGYVNASVDIRGSITDPEFFGTARGTSLRIRIPEYMPQELRPIPFTVVLDGNEMRFGPVSTSVGNGMGTVSAWFRFDRWIPNNFSIDIAVPRETPIPYGFNIIGFMAHGDVYGNMNVSMENVAFDISGNLYGNNTELSINSEEIAKSQEKDVFAEAKIPFAVDLTVTTGPVVEFFYPNVRFPILRANPNMGTVLKVSVDSQTQRYSLNSDIKIRGGEIFYFERSFYIRSGTLVFRENELRFEPRLTARAEIRDRHEDGPVTISMLVENAPLLSFTARFESTPSLTQMEIFELLGHSVTGSQFDESGVNQRAFINASSDLLAQLFLVRQLEQVVSNVTKLDMFSFRTQVLQNALLMSGDSTNRVGNYFDNTTVFGGKYIGQDMFIQGMLSVDYDENRTNFGGLTLRPDIGVELQNPLFSIRWDFVPTHPENWYLNDNSITLTRSWTF